MSRTDVAGPNLRPPGERHDTLLPGSDEKVPLHPYTGNESCTEMAQLPDQVARPLIDATGAQSPSEAVKWIAEGHPLKKRTDPHAVLRALVGLDDPIGGNTDKAIVRLARHVSRSQLDSARVIFQIDELERPARYRRAIDTLAWKSPTKTLDGLTAEAVFAAQREDTLSMETLCLMAGITFNNLKDWTDTPLPAQPTNRWSLAQVAAAFAVIKEFVEEDGDVGIPNATLSRPAELVLVDHTQPTGWAAIEQMRRAGVPYETLLVLRATSGPWSAHRNRTGRNITNIVAKRLATELDERGIRYHLTYHVGGEVSNEGITTLTGTSGPIGLIATNSGGDPAFAVIFSLARDGGTARRTGNSLVELGEADVPIALVLSGPGWSERNETGKLAVRYEGRLYSDDDLEALADTVAEALNHDRENARW